MVLSYNFHRIYVKMNSKLMRNKYHTPFVRVQCDNFELFQCSAKETCMPTSADRCSDLSGKIPLDTGFGHCQCGSFKQCSSTTPRCNSNDHNTPLAATMCEKCVVTTCKQPNPFCAPNGECRVCFYPDILKCWLLLLSWQLKTINSLFLHVIFF